MRGGFFNGQGYTPCLEGEAGSKVIAHLIERGEPAAVLRYGTYELMAVARHLYGAPFPEAMKRLHWNAGFFPEDARYLGRFSDIYTEATRVADCFIAWNYRHKPGRYEEQVFRDFCPAAQVVDITGLNCFSLEAPWTAALEGRRVLVVHPFAATIEAQYERRELIYPERNVLPRFASLHTIRAVQSIAGTQPAFSNWFEALASMEREIEAIDRTHGFDAAIIGCGAYGFPLAAHIKRMGKVAIHLAGATQILFGIMGKRWEARYAHLMTDAWVRPSADERPSEFNSIERGAYW